MRLMTQRRKRKKKNPHAVAMGKVGGRKTSRTKTAAAQINAKKLRSPAAIRALTIAHDYGATPGKRQKAWVIDQMVRALTGVFYDSWVIRVGVWDQGIAPTT
jgi:hypothetical protein